MDIEFIKKCVPYADEFDLYNNGDDMFPDWVLWHAGCEVDPISGDFHKTAQSQLLLQRAIEGINRKYYEEGGKYLILPCGSHQYEVYKEDDLMNGWTFDNIDATKTAALEYVFEMEG